MKSITKYILIVVVTGSLAASLAVCFYRLGRRDLCRQEVKIYFEALTRSDPQQDTARREYIKARYYYLYLESGMIPAKHGYYKDCGTIDFRILGSLLISKGGVEDQYLHKKFIKRGNETMSRH